MPTQQHMHHSVTTKPDPHNHRNTNTSSVTTTATLYQTHKGAPLGLGLREEWENQSSDNRPFVSIYQIAGPAAAQDTGLRVGMRLLRINDVAPVQSLDLAVYLLQHAEQGTLTIVAAVESSLPSSVGGDAGRRHRSSGSQSSRRRKLHRRHRQEKIRSDSSSCSLTQNSDDEYDDDILVGLLCISRASTEEQARALLEPCPPQGIDTGGIWGTHMYVGRQTLETSALYSVATGVQSGVLGMICCPQDEEPAYKLGRWIYALDGSCMGHVFWTNFQPSRIVPVYDSKYNRKQQTHWRIVQ